MMRITVVALVVAACDRTPPPPPAANPDCASLVADNAVRTEMVQLECVLQRVVTAIGRDNLAAVGPLIETVDRAKQATERALETGSYKLAQGDLTAFRAMDEAFHHALVGLVEASAKNDHAATAAALGTVLAQCQTCHATFRKTTPPR